MADAGSLILLRILASEVSGSAHGKPVSPKKWDLPCFPDLTCPFASATVLFTKLRVVPNQSLACYSDAQTSLLGSKLREGGVCARRNSRALAFRAFILSTVRVLNPNGFCAVSIVQKRKNRWVVPGAASASNGRFRTCSKRQTDTRRDPCLAAARI